MMYAITNIVEVEKQNEKIIKTMTITSDRYSNPLQRERDIFFIMLMIIFSEQIKS